MSFSSCQQNSAFFVVFWKTKITIISTSLTINVVGLTTILCCCCYYCCFRLFVDWCHFIDSVGSKHVICMHTYGSRFSNRDKKNDIKFSLKFENFSTLQQDKNDQQKISILFKFRSFAWIFFYYHFDCNKNWS